MLLKNSIRLNATLFTRTTAVVRNWRAIFNGLDIQASRLKSSDRTFTPAAWPFDTNVDFFDAEFRSLVSSLLGGTLAGKRSTLSASFKTASSRTGPAKGFALGVGDRDRRIVKGRVNVRDSVSHVTPDSSLFCFCHCFCFSWLMVISSLNRIGHKST